MKSMNQPIPDSIGIIAGKDLYPLLLAESVRKAGVKRIVSVAFRGETRRRINKLSDEVFWLYVGQTRRMLEVFQQAGVRHVIMAGQITPTLLFRIHMDELTKRILDSLPVKNAHTIFNALVRELEQCGMTVLPANAFMDEYMPPPGVLTSRQLTEVEERDVLLGRNVLMELGKFDIGQTVIIKNGTIIAVEAFEGTDATIKRAGRLAGKGFVVVKIARKGHDMRFDIPVVGMRTMRTLYRSGGRVLALESGRSVILELSKVIEYANRKDLSILILEPIETVSTVREGVFNAK
jgi:DUF1009 family protein